MKLIHFGYLIFAIYIIAYIGIPIYISIPSPEKVLEWENIFEIWESWQTLTAGMVALFASFIAFHITAHKLEEERKRNFIAARAFLPHALSEICTYCDNSLLLYNSSLEKINKKEVTSYNQLKQDYPDLSIKSLEIIKNCILYSDQTVGKFLADILNELQVCDARMGYSFNHNETKYHRMLIIKENLFPNIFSVCLLKAHTYHIFEFARGEPDFENKKFESKDLLSVIRSANLYNNNFEGIEEYFDKSLSSK